MSQEQQKAVVPCTKCQKPIEVNCWQILNADVHPEAKEALLQGTIYDVVCPHCGTKGTVNYPMLYHNQAQQVVIEYVESEASVEESIKHFQETFGTIKKKPYSYRVVLSPNELREKAIAFEYGLNDGVIELIKVLFVSKLQMEQPEKKIAHVFFFVAMPGEYVLQFIEMDGNSFMLELPQGMYEDLNKEFAPKLEQQLAAAYQVNLDWAFKVLSTN